LNSPFTEENRRLALDLMTRNSARKPRALINAQQESMQQLCDHLILRGEEPENVICDWDTGAVITVKNGEARLHFAQCALDDLVREKFHVFRSWLPASYRVHGLSPDHVGALATPAPTAFVCFADSERDDFIAFSAGVDRLPLWGLAVTRSLGTRCTPPVPSSAIDPYPAAWWSNCLAPLAADILGWPIDHERVSLLTDWVGGVDISGEASLTLIGTLEGFVVFHEIGHFELNHGSLFRQVGLHGDLPTEQCYRLEYEADEFAMRHLLRGVRDINSLSSCLAILFALFALNPTYIEQYPTCPSAERHPHPLRRLVWLLRLLYPGDLVEQSTSLMVAIKTITNALGYFDIPPDSGYGDLIHEIVMQSPGPLSVEGRLDC
jgi:hypothetical protein